MNTPTRSFSIFVKLEEWLNQLVLKLFPVWYISQAAADLDLQKLGRINPRSYLSSRWLNLRAVASALSNSLQEGGERFQSLESALNKLITEKELNRRFSIHQIHGVEQSAKEEDWTTLIAYAEAHPELLVDFEEVDQFIEALNQAFPEETRPHRFLYREWDGRAYWMNQESPDTLAGLQHHAHESRRDGNIFATITVEGINGKALDLIRDHWWMLLFERASIVPVYELMKNAGLPVVLGDFEWRRNDLAVLVAPKNNREVNQILLNLIHKRSAKEVIELGSYIGRQHFPLKSSEKKGES